MSKRFTDVLPQHFPFPSDLMAYVCENAFFEVLKKLYKTCKHFYARIGCNIIESLVVQPYYISFRESYSEKQIRIKAEKEEEERLIGKLCITLSLTILSPHNFRGLMSKIYRCELCSIHIKTDGLTLEDLKFLCNDEILTNVWIRCVVFSNDSLTELATLEDILPLMPAVDQLW